MAHSKKPNRTFNVSELQKHPHIGISIPDLNTPHRGLYPNIEKFLLGVEGGINFI
jgi:hypothetical protein